MIELSRICRTYELGGEPVRALVEVTETIARGEHLAIMGPSGSGKSTLLNLIGLLDRPTSGSYRFEDREVSGLTEEELTLLRRHRIGFVFQAFHLVPRLTAIENVELPMIFARVAQAQRRVAVELALDQVGLRERGRHRPAELSGGERQRVAIARAVVMSPSVLLADEPTGNLDSRSGRAVLDLLERMNRDGLTLVVVTHDPAVAQRAGRVLFLRDGRVEERVGHDEFARAYASWGLEAPR